MALQGQPNAEGAAAGGAVELAICNASQVLHSEVLAEPSAVELAAAVFSGASDVGGGREGAGREGREPAALVVEVGVDVARGSVDFLVNGRKIGSRLQGLQGAVVLAVQMTSLGDRVELLHPCSASTYERTAAPATSAGAAVGAGGGGGSASRSRSGKGGGGGGGEGVWSIEDRVKILREKGNVAFKAQDFRHAVQVLSRVWDALACM